MKKVIYKSVTALALFGVGVTFGRTVFGLVRVEGVSMEPTLADGSLNGVYWLEESVPRGSIVVANLDGLRVVKRVIALEGDRVSYRGNKFYVNGKAISDEVIFSEDTKYLLGWLAGGREYVVPEKGYFLLGDNYTNSSDSRQVGAVGREDILGILIR